MHRLLVGTFALALLMALASLWAPASAMQTAQSGSALAQATASAPHVDTIRSHHASSRGAVIDDDAELDDEALLPAELSPSFTSLDVGTPGQRSEIMAAPAMPSRISPPEERPPQRI